MPSWYVTAHHRDEWGSGGRRLESSHPDHFSLRRSALFFSSSLSSARHGRVLVLNYPSAFLIADDWSRFRGMIQLVLLQWSVMIAVQGNVPGKPPTADRAIIATIRRRDTNERVVKRRGAEFSYSPISCFVFSRAERTESRWPSVTVPKMNSR